MFCLNSRAIWIMTLLLPMAAGAKPSTPEQTLLSAAADGEAARIQKLPANTDWNVSDAEGETALIKAISHEHPELVPILLKKKVDVDHKDKTGNTALLYAVSANDPKTAKMLVEAGASVELQYDKKKENILFEVSRVGSIEIADLVLKKRKDLLNDANLDGQTPIFAAIENAQFELAMHFLKRGASTRLKLKDGRSLAAFAKANGVKDSTPLMRRILELK